MSECTDKLIIAATSAFGIVIVFYLCLYFYLVMKGMLSANANKPIDIPGWLNVSVPSWLVSKGTQGGGFGPDPFWGPITLTADSKKCWDVDGGINAKKNGTALQVWDCSGASNQSFFYDSDKEALKVQNSNKCVDVPKNKQQNGQLLDIWDCNGGASQKWIPSGDSFQLDGTNFCIDLPGNNSNNGSKLQLYDCNEAPAQSWVHVRK